MKVNLSATMKVSTVLLASMSLSQYAHAFIASSSKCKTDYISRHDAKKKIDHEYKCGRLSSQRKRSLERASSGKLKHYPDVVSHQREFTIGYTRKIYSYKDDFGLNRGSCESSSQMSPYKTTVCTSDCFTPDQQVLFSAGELAIGEEFNQFNHQVMTLDPKSTLQSMNYVAKDVAYFTQSIEEDDHEVMTLTMASGGQLRVSSNHPLLSADGLVKRASTFQQGDSLVQDNGTLDPIANIEVSSYAGKLYNLEPKNADEQPSLIVAQGYVSGSFSHETERDQYVKRIVARDYLPDDLI